VRGNAIRYRVIASAITVAASFGAGARDGDLCSGVTIEDGFRRAAIVVLVQVRESSFPYAASSPEELEEKLENARAAAATLLVIKSWKGPYTTDATVRAVQPQFCGGFPCHSYPFRAGEILLVFAREYEEPISPAPSCSVIDEAHARSAMKALFALVNRGVN
jgi:hypothetical protein